MRPFKLLLLMDWNPIASAGAGVIGAISGAIQNRKNREFEAEQARIQREWSEQQTDKQNAWNLEQWQREMDYNSPTNQLQRLRDAGLNPLYYGLDGNSTGSSPTAAQPLGYERATLGNLPNPVAAGLDAAAKVAQISNVQADTAKKNNENLTETQRRENMLTENLKLSQELKNLAAQEGLTKVQISQINKALEWTDRLNEAIISEKESSAKLSSSQRKRIDELLENEKVLQVKSIQDFDEKWKKIAAEISQIAKGNNLLDKDIENYALNHMQNGFMGTGLSFPNLIRELKEIILGKGENKDPVETSTGVNTNGENLNTRHGLPVY